MTTNWKKNKFYLYRALNFLSYNYSRPCCRDYCEAKACQPRGFEVITTLWAALLSGSLLWAEFPGWLDKSAARPTSVVDKLRDRWAPLVPSLQTPHLFLSLFSFFSLFSLFSPFSHFFSLFPGADTGFKWGGGGQKYSFIIRNNKFFWT